MQDELLHFLLYYTFLHFINSCHYYQVFSCILDQIISSKMFYSFIIITHSVIDFGKKLHSFNLSDLLFLPSLIPLIVKEHVHSPIEQ